MTQGRTPGTQGLFNSSRDYCDAVLPERSIHRLLYEHGDALFPDAFFEDLYSRRGRNSVPPRILATAMVLQRLEGLSDREAVGRFMFDTRWKYACGGLEAEYPGFVHTVFVSMRARLRDSEHPTRIFDAVVDVAKQAGLVGARRALDSTPLYDAVATQDTVTLIRSAIRGVLRCCDVGTQTHVRGVLKRDDRYKTPGKPVCAWDDAEAREQLVDDLARDGYAILAFFDGEQLGEKLDEAVRLLAVVLGQDLEDDEGRFRIARRVAPDRVISTVDPDARHGHKTSARGFDGYKGHVAIDPDSEIITSTAVSSGNVGDGKLAEDLLSDVLSAPEPEPSADSTSTINVEQPSYRAPVEPSGLWCVMKTVLVTLGTMAGLTRSSPNVALDRTPVPVSPAKTEVYGDASYGAAHVLQLLDAAKIAVYTRVQEPSSRSGLFSQNAFTVDLDARSVTCPAGISRPLKARADGSSAARFGKKNCADCGLRASCTKAKSGRTLNIHAHHKLLTRYREQQREPEWKRAYQATRPKVERKLAHLVRRKHGGRRARVRGLTRVGNDFSLLAAATNLARLAQLGLEPQGGQWTVATGGL